MPMFRHTNHRQLKNRAQKRRVSSHQYHPHHEACDNQNYTRLRNHQLALNKIKHNPQLMEKVWQNWREKQQCNPEAPQLAQWHQLLESCTTIEALSEAVLGCSTAAGELRKYSVLDCLFE